MSEARPPAVPAPVWRAPRTAGGPLAAGRSKQQRRRMDDADYAPSLECRVAFADDTAWVQPVGEVDLVTMALVEERLEDVRAARAGHVILDLRDARFIAATFLPRALGGRERARRERFAFALM